MHATEVQSKGANARYMRTVTFEYIGTCCLEVQGFTLSFPHSRKVWGL